MSITHLIILTLALLQGDPDRTTTPDRLVWMHLEDIGGVVEIRRESIGTSVAFVDTLLAGEYDIFGTRMTSSVTSARIGEAHPTSVTLEAQDVTFLIGTDPTRNQSDGLYMHPGLHRFRGDGPRILVTKGLPERIVFVGPVGEHIGVLHQSGRLKLFDLQGRTIESVQTMPLRAHEVLTTEHARAIALVRSWKRTTVVIPVDHPENVMEFDRRAWKFEGTKLLATERNEDVLLVDLASAPSFGAATIESPEIDLEFLPIVRWRIDGSWQEAETTFSTGHWHRLRIIPSDGIAWISDRDSLWRFSREGALHIANLPGLANAKFASSEHVLVDADEVRTFMPLSPSRVNRKPGSFIFNVPDWLRHRRVTIYDVDGHVVLDVVIPPSTTFLLDGYLVAVRKRDDVMVCTKFTPIVEITNLDTLETIRLDLSNPD